MNNPDQPVILIVDDDRLSLNILNSILRNEHRIKAATDGLRGLALARALPRPDLILLDVAMPGLNGFEVCKALKNDPDTADIPILFITARSSEENEVRGLEMGGADFISKPIRPEIVRARVRVQLTLLQQKRQLQQMHDQVLALSLTDGLTGLANRRRFDQFLQQELTRSQRAQSPLGLLMMDVDHFKCYNDHYGHVAGDSCLKRLADVLASQAQRPPDFIARYGGEEFACVLPDTDLDGVRKVGRGILDAIRGLCLPHPASPTEEMLTFSIGGTAIIPQRTTKARQLIDGVDSFLYESKNKGRNCMTVRALAEPVQVRIGQYSDLHERLETE